MKPAHKARLRALRRELLEAEASEDAKREAEVELDLKQAGIVDEAPLEADDPEREPTHPDTTPPDDRAQGFA